MVDVERILKGYDMDRISVATIASHSAINILRGAKRAGLRTIAVARPGTAWFYRRLWFVEEVIEVDFEELENVADRLVRENSILVPHGSFVEYIGWRRALRFPVPILGNRHLLEWEADQRKKMKLLEHAGIPIPRHFESPEKVDRPVMVKFGGAKGGRGYFLARGREELLKRLKDLGWGGDAFIQEYVIGVPAYYHYFSSRVRGRVELFGADIRYESNVDGRVFDLAEPSFVVVGNIPIVMRESLLPRILSYGEQFVKAVEELVPPGLPGPFCLESIVKDDLSIVVFEFSGRIVAGTNTYMGVGSPYSILYFEDPIDMGERIGIEVKEASSLGKIHEVVT